MRIIDADALLDYLDEEQPKNWTNSDAEIQQQSDWDTFRFMIDVQPTVANVEADEVVSNANSECGCGGKHEWRVTNNWNNIFGRGVTYTCNKCGQIKDIMYN